MKSENGIVTVCSDSFVAQSHVNLIINEDFLLFESFSFLIINTKNFRLIEESNLRVWIEYLDTQVS